MRSLDDLIEYLLEEIALSGEEGLTFLDLATSIQRFYGQHHLDASAPEDNANQSEGHSTQSTSFLDIHFLEKVYEWLGRHPDVSIGTDGQYNETSLSDLEKLFPGYTLHDRRSESQSTAPNAASEDGEGSSDQDIQPPTSRKKSHSNKSKVNQNKIDAGPRLYVTEERMYLAICGHPPDPKKVFASEWVLLSHIAAARGNGILQGELGRLSGQDKRSVPKRTDRLQQNGYIVKKAVYIKGTKTSRIFLSQFISHWAKNTDDTERKRWQYEKLTIKYQSRQLFEVLKSNPLIAQNDLVRALHMNSIGKARVLSLMIRHFSKKGCLKRVRTAFGPSSQSSDLKVCVQYLREPQDADWTQLNAGGIDFDMSVEELAQPYDHSGAAGEDSVLYELEDEEEDEEEVQEAEEYEESKHQEKVSRYIPRWNPDRILTNVLVECSKTMGLRGMKNMDARKSITGVFVRRMIESLLIKVSHQSLLSQPPELRSLAIIRSKESADSLVQYLHYSIEAFQEKVEKGKAAWENVRGGNELLKELQISPSRKIEDLAYSKDDFGFPLRSRPGMQLQNGKSTVAASVKHAKVSDMKLGATLSERNINSDLGLSSTEKASKEIKHKLRTGLEHSRNNAFEDESTRELNATPKKSKSAPAGEVTRGRPRKFLRGTEAFWRETFIMVRRQADPTHFSKSNKRGVMTDSAGTEVFKNRPSNFDETLVRALEAGLPVPSTPQDINAQWVLETIAFLDSGREGLYFTPTGTHLRSRHKPSKVMKLKSSRLPEIDFTDRQNRWGWQVLSSSAAHSKRYLRFYPLLERSTLGSKVQSKPAGGTQKQNTNFRQARPPRGTFLENVRPSIPLERKRPSEQISLEVRYARDEDLSDATEIDPELSQYITHVDETIPQQRSQTPASGHPQSFAETLANTGDLDRKVEDNSILSLPPQTYRPESFNRNQAESLIRPDDFDATSQAATNGPESQQKPGTEDRLNHAVTVEGQTDDDTVHSTPSVENAADDLCAVEVELSSNYYPSSVQDIAHATAVPGQGDVNNYRRVMRERDHVGTPNHTNDHDNIGQQMSPKTEAAYAIAQEPNLDNDNNATNMPSEEAMSPTRSSRSMHRHRKSSSEISDTVRSGKRVKNNATESTLPRGEMSKHCRNIALDLVKMCSGLAPSDPWTFRRAMVGRWSHAHLDGDPPTAKIVRKNLALLANGTTVKHITFAYRNKSGVMTHKTIIALRKFASTDSEVLELQRKMIEADPEDYVPPELVAEFARVPAPLPTRKGKKGEVNQNENENENENRGGEGEREQMLSTPKSPRRRKSAILPVESPAHAGFLTLKVPGLHTLDIPTKYQLHYTLPEASGRHDDSTISPDSMSATIPPAVDRRNTLRPKKIVFDTQTHMIVWKNSTPTNLPKSLDDVPNINLSREEASLAHTSNPNLSLFDAEVECVANWEQKSSAIFQEKFDAYCFINHTVSADDVHWSHTGPVKFANLVAFGQNGKATLIDCPSENSWEPFIQALERAKNVEEPAAPAVRQKRKYIKRKNRHNDEETDFEPIKRRKVVGRRPRTRAPGQQNTEGALRRKSMKFRRPVQVIRHMPAELQYCIIVSIIVVRTLAGGVEKFIDWRIVMRLFPDQEEDYIQTAWKSLLNRYRNDVQGLTESLQDRYLDSLADGLVPTINFENILATNWEGILNWALTNLEKLQIEKVEDLPSTRQQLEAESNLTFNVVQNFGSTLNFGASTSQARKDELLAGIVFGKQSRQQETVEGLTDVPCNEERARSWALSLLLTPEAKYSPDRAHRTLLQLAKSPKQCDSLLMNALQHLQRAKMVIRQKEAGNTSTHVADSEMKGVRTWTASAKFYEQFGARRQITEAMLKAAAKYKIEVLDGGFSQGQSISIGKESVSYDGHMVAIVNLLVAGAIKIQPGPDLPDTRYGLDWQRQGYSTKLIDKSTLGFSIVLSPITHLYKNGDPLAEQRTRVSIPRGEIDDPQGMGRIPPWFDINLEFLPSMWEMMISAIVGLISMRPGIDNKELSESVASALTAWEVGLLTQYLCDIGAVKLTNGRKGWITKTWWWFCIGTGHE